MVGAAVVADSTDLVGSKVMWRAEMPSKKFAINYNQNMHLYI